MMSLHRASQSFMQAYFPLSTFLKARSGSRQALRQAKSALLWLLVAALILSSCGQDTQEADHPMTLQATATQAGKERLVIFGPYGFKQILTALGPYVEGAGLDYEFEIWDGVSTSAGIQGVLDGTFDLMILMRWPRPNEPVAFVEFLQTPVALFVNPTIGIDNITREQAAAVFSGEITNWAQLGGADVEIVVFVQKSDDTMTQAVQDYILGEKSFTLSAQIINEERDVFSVVESIPGGIGYAAWAGKRFWEFVLSTTFLEPVKLDGLAPEDPDYPFTSPIGVAFLPERQPDLQPILDLGYDMMTSDLAPVFVAQFGVRLAPVLLSAP
jgi:phosphate transport system substrate-binding protein